MHSFNLISVALVLTTAASCSKAGSGAVKDSSKADSAFAQMQSRGHMAMGVDQYESAHRFDVTRDGGRIELQSSKYHSLDVAQIRAHMKLIQHAFAAGDFTTPAFVHNREMPGTVVMAKRKSAITYTYSDLPRGGEVRMTTTDPEARDAIAQFLAAQRQEHHAMGTQPLK